MITRTFVKMALRGTPTTMSVKKSFQIKDSFAIQFTVVYFNHAVMGNSFFDKPPTIGIQNQTVGHKSKF